MPPKKGQTKKTTSMDTNPTPKAEGSPEPHEVNSALDSDRMKALLEDHRKMGARP